MVKFNRDEFQKLILDLVQEDAGELKEKLKYHFKSPGKLVRAKLNFELLQFLGVSNDNATTWAMITELIHNASLIHDDLQDGDSYRRNQKSYWNQFGVNSAINAGDFLIMKASLAIKDMKVTDEVKWRLNESLMSTSMQLVRGQELEESMKGFPQNELWERYLQCVDEKTASLFLMAVTASEILVGPTSESEKIREAFLRFGTCFQLHDDLVDILGDKGRESKANDLREGKWSSLVIKYFLCSPDQEESFKVFLLKPRNEVENSEVLYWVGELQRSGVILDSLCFLQKELKNLNESIGRSPEALQDKMYALVKKSFFLEDLQQ